MNSDTISGMIKLLEKYPLDMQLFDANKCRYTITEIVRYEGHHKVPCVKLTTEFDPCSVEINVLNLMSALIGISMDYRFLDHESGFGLGFIISHKEFGSSLKSSGRFSLIDASTHPIIHLAWVDFI